MTDLDTQDLMEALKSNQELQAVLQQNLEEFIEPSLPEALSILLAAKGLTRAQAIRNAKLNTIYGQQIFSGSRTPSRDKLLAIAFGMGLTFQETDTLLKQQRYPRLYPRNERDAVLIYALLHNLSLADTNILLSQNQQEPLI